MLKKISTVARVKLFYVACSKNGFLPWTLENDQRQLLAQSRSTSESVTSSGTFLVVLQITMNIMLSTPHLAKLGKIEMELLKAILNKI